MFVKLTLKVPVDEIDLNQMARFQKRGIDLAVNLTPVPPDQAELPGTSTGEEE